jgi:hypothetical protein
MRWTSGTGEVVDFVHLNEQRVDYVMVYQFEVFMTDPVLHVALAPREKIVGYYDFMALKH